MNDIHTKVAQALKTKAMDKVVATPITTRQAGEARIEERKLEAVAPITGYPDLDSKIKGWIPGHLYVLTGETNAGKSACACNFTCRVAKQGKKVTYFALEPDVGVIEYIAGIYHDKKWADISDNDLLLDIPEISIFTKESHTTLEQLLNTIETMERQDLVIVDHIGYFTNNPNDKRTQVQQESDAMKRIIGTAKKKGSAVMIIAHPRKGSSTSKKRAILNMNDISGSAAYKQDTTDILILHMFVDENDPYQITNSPDGIILLPKIKTGKGGYTKIHFLADSPIMLEEDELANRVAFRL